MKRIPLFVLLALAVMLSVFAFASVFAQTGEGSSLDGNSASLSIVETLPVTASVDININGQIYKVAIPATVIIDAQKSLAEALLTAQEVNRIGDLQWNITDIVEYDGEFEFAPFQSVAPLSPDSKIVVVESLVTNLDSEPFDTIWGTENRFAYDELGNLYEHTDMACDNVNPGNTQPCLLAFDVPKDVTILGLDIAVRDHGRIPFTSQE
jgi:hypothetical protein